VAVPRFHVRDARPSHRVAEAVGGGFLPVPHSD
jgi:hypothetical protein